MRKNISLALVLVCLFNLQIFAQKRTVRPVPQKNLQSVENGTTLPIRRVILYSNGVAYIERRGFVSGNAEINLSFKQSQVDDVLKSMVVLDLGQGKIGAVSYNSSAPVSARMSEIPFNVDAKSVETDESSGGLAGVLSQLQGAKVIVTSTKGTATGSVLTVEKRQIITKKKDDEEVSLPFSYSLVISSETGEISNFDLAEIRSVKLLDEGARKDLNEFANAAASARRRDAKTITVTSEGAGQREMVVSYTIAAPIWKTTYRVVLDEAGKPFFQGWAIVDNVSDEDWQNVRLSLVSGSPVSFIQTLQKPLYRYRPIVPIPEDLNLQPQIYDPEIGKGEGDGIGDGMGNGMGNGRVDTQDEVVKVDGADLTSNYIKVETSLSTALVNEQAGIKTAAIGAEFGDLFEYRIEQPVTVSRNRSALIPIVQTKLDGERVSIYNEEAQKDRPMSGMLLTNLTALTFESGSLTVFDRDAYAGEALMERLKPKERRLISFALDLGTLVSVEQKEDREPAKLIKAVNGVFQVHYFKTSQKIYRLVNQTDRTKIVYIEHPKTENWILSDSSPKPDIITDRFYRFRVELQPFDKKDFTVSEKQGLMDSYQLTGLTSRDLELFVTRRYVDETTRTKLQKLIELRSQINQINQKISALDIEISAIGADQERLRENIETLAKTAEARQLIMRYIQQVNEQENRLEIINKEKQTLSAEKSKLEGDLANLIGGFELERNPQ